MKRLLTVLGVIVVSACAGSIANPEKVGVKYQPEDGEYIFAGGSNTVKGQAFLRQNGGGIVTCAGQEVKIFPKTAYSTARFNVLYGTTSAVAQRRLNAVEAAAPGYERQSLRGQCDAQGNFSIGNVPDGDFYVVTVVEWFVGIRRQGGGVFAPVSVQNGETVEIIMAPTGV